MTKRRGNAVEKHAIGILENLGYIVEKARPIRRKAGKMTFTEREDFFGAFDLVCVQPGRRTLFVQVTTENVALGTKLTQIRDALGHLSKEFHDVQIWRWKKPVPGQRGSFLLHAWDQDFPPGRSAPLIRTDARYFPWENPQRSLSDV